jgi:hypothetical protein
MFLQKAQIAKALGYRSEFVEGNGIDGDVYTKGSYSYLDLPERCSDEWEEVTCKQYITELTRYPVIYHTEEVEYLCAKISRDTIVGIIKKVDEVKHYELRKVPR